MKRKDFLKVCTLLGISTPIATFLNACDGDDSLEGSYDGKVIIVGAGAGGLAAGYLLERQGVNFEILEASAAYGGRMRISTDFADFPIPLGAEWLHTSTDIFSEIVEDDSQSVTVNTVSYGSDATYAEWQNGGLQVGQLNDSDIKFVNSSWYNFFDEYIVPSIKGRIRFDSIVSSIDYTGSKIKLTVQNETIEADKVIISVPLKVLQDGDIHFAPSFPASKTEAINNLLIWDGFKAFFEFSTRFYDTQIGFEISPNTDGQKLFYDASYGQNTSRNILGVFTVGTPAATYMNLDDESLKATILAELDAIYGGQATPAYIKHLTQDWNAEPYIKGGYLTDHANWRTVARLSESIADKIYFAGGPYTDGNDWVSVHAAAASARTAVQGILR